jgi:hypothetical protein
MRRVERAPLSMYLRVASEQNVGRAELLNLGSIG